MKKQGFTLAELMIALGIIGVAAALMAPALRDIMPDKYKIRVLNYYGEISHVTTGLIMDKAAYYAPLATVGGVPVLDENGKPKRSCIGLACEGASRTPYPAYSGATKYQNLLYNQLGIEGGKYRDGSTWSVTGSGGSYTITIDADGSSKGKNCMAPSCRKPDKFKFTVDKYGNVVPADPMSAIYVKHSDRLNKDEDREEAF